ncbi:hypothetical protein PV371_33505 [Streptomyces sp. TX20-6-3]|uniref:hypothetical protein n=1 Tax=Streptomyces sp. TX20-6-3 TaxID=3028705 RepID=UPI0029A4F01B|nr:hypothetical protein [Streptomyces sp. TX20-6-3]MDX2564542.1 hypothetical protein [Streptomyces sp. TX20-6-3]
MDADHRQGQLLRTTTSRRGGNGVLVKSSGLVLLLALLFAVSYAVGRLVGPVSPELRPGWSPPRDETGQHGMGLERK